MRIITQRALVLNQDYSPITICSAAKAFLLLYLQKAELIEKDESQQLRSIDQSFPFPSVIRLSSYVKIPYKTVVMSRQNIFKRDDYKCQYCFASKHLTLDHLIPRSKGGKTAWTNLVTACQKCNAKKGNNTLKESGLTLSRMPFKPNYVMFIRDFSGDVDQKWLPFLKTKKLSA